MHSKNSFLTTGYFRRLFRTKFNDSSSPEVCLTGPLGIEIGSGTIETILEFIYTEEVELNNQNVYAVLHAAEYLDIEQLKNICVQYLKATINHDSWIATYRIAIQLNIGCLLSHCMDHFLHVFNVMNFNQIKFTEFDSILSIQVGAFVFATAFTYRGVYLRLFLNASMFASILRPRHARVVKMV